MRVSDIRTRIIDFKRIIFENLLDIIIFITGSNQTTHAIMIVVSKDERAY